MERERIRVREANEGLSLKTVKVDEVVFSSLADAQQSTRSQIKEQTKSLVLNRGLGVVMGLAGLTSIGLWVDGNSRVSLAIVAFQIATSILFLNESREYSNKRKLIKRQADAIDTYHNKLLSKGQKKDQENPTIIIKK